MSALDFADSVTYMCGTLYVGDIVEVAGKP